jgi:hypothetical protein
MARVALWMVFKPDNGTKSMAILHYNTQPTTVKNLIQIMTLYSCPALPSGLKSKPQGKDQPILAILLLFVP